MERTNQITKYLVFFITIIILGSNIAFSLEIDIQNNKKTSAKNEYNKNFNYRSDIFYVGGNGPNNYTKIQYAINNASDWDTIFVYDYSSPYYEKLTVNKSVEIIGEDKNTTIISSNESGDIIQISSYKVKIQGFTILDTSNTRTGIKIFSDRNTIQDNIIINTGCGIFIKDSENNTILNNQIFNSYYGLYVYSYSSYNHIENNIIQNNTYGIIFFYTKKMDLSQNTISNNSYGIYFHSSSKDSIYDNLILNNDYGISLIGSDNDSIFQNTISNNEFGIHSYSSSNNILIFRNIVVENENGIKLDWHSNKNSLQNNTVTDNTNGIILNSYGNKNLVINNVILNNSNGISLVGNSKNNKIAKNIISGNNNAINLSNSFSNSIKENTIAYNIEGIKFCNLGDENTIFCNKINHNELGINLDCNSKRNIIYCNSLSNNTYGIYVWDSSNDNLFYHNNFKTNIQNAYDDCVNQWDNGYPCGGNYWDDYIGTYVTPDGLGGSPYHVPGGVNEDQYPLIHSYELYYILNITAKSIIEESTEFFVEVNSLGGTPIPDAKVDFDDESKNTDTKGIVSFIAPTVKQDSIFIINVTKQGYVNTSKNVIVKNMPSLKLSIIYGKITNLIYNGSLTTFEAVNTKYLTLLPFRFHRCKPGELITISEFYFGLLNPEFIFSITLVLVYTP